MNRTNMSSPERPDEIRYRLAFSADLFVDFDVPEGQVAE